MYMIYVKYFGYLAIVKTFISELGTKGHLRYETKRKKMQKIWCLARILTLDPGYYICPPYPLSCILNIFCVSLIITMILMRFLYIPVSPIYINALVMYKGRSLPTYVKSHFI